MGCRGACLEQDAGRGADLHGGPAALEAARGVVHKARLLGVWEVPAGDPAQQRHQLAPVAHAQAEGVRPAQHHETLPGMPGKGQSL